MGNKTADKSGHIKALILTEDNHRDAQLMALANALGAEIQTDKAPRAEHYVPDVILASAPRANNLAESKRRFNLKPLAVCFHQPEEMLAELDAIIAPSYEPLPDDPRVIPTTGLLNSITPQRLDDAMAELEREAMLPLSIKLESLPKPYVAVLVGGHHVGGNITIDDGMALAKLLNQDIKRLGGSCLITNSSRTEQESYEALLNSLHVPFFAYDYKRRTMPNPFDIFLNLAEILVVTGDSVRMLSQAATLGKPTWIYDSPSIAFNTKPLQEELLSMNAAKRFGKYPLDAASPHTAINEATRVAGLIRSML